MDQVIVVVNTSIYPIDFFCFTKSEIEPEMLCIHKPPFSKLLLNHLNKKTKTFRCRPDGSMETFLLLACCCCCCCFQKNRTMPRGWLDDRQVGQDDQTSNLRDPKTRFFTRAFRWNAGSHTEKNTPGRLTAGTWRWWVWKNFLFQGCILRFHVNLPER